MLFPQEGNGHVSPHSDRSDHEQEYRGNRRNSPWRHQIQGSESPNNKHHDAERRTQNTRGTPRKQCMFFQATGSCTAIHMVIRIHDFQEVGKGFSSSRYDDVSLGEYFPTFREHSTFIFSVKQSVKNSHVARKGYCIGMGRARAVAGEPKGW